MADYGIPAACSFVKTYDASSNHHSSRASLARTGIDIPGEFVRKNNMNTSIMRLLSSLFLTFMAVQASAQDSSVTLSVDGKPALVLQAPSAAKITSSNAYVNIRTTNMSLHVWAVSDAKIADDAAPRAGDLIKSEFKNFKPRAVKDLVIAGAPAKHVSGPGNEADDDDPGNAEVVLFEVGDHVFAACVHGEFDDASRALAPMMAMLKTAHAPP